MASEAGATEDILIERGVAGAVGVPGSITLPELRLRLGRRTLALLAALWAWNGVFIAAGLGLLAALVYVRQTSFINPDFDDSFITLTFARNLAEHGRLSFDGHVWSTGATSTLHVLVLAGLLKLGAAPLFASVAVGVATHVLLAVGVYMLTWAIFRERIAALLGAAAISFCSFAALDVVNGMETGLFMSLLALTCAAYLLARDSRGRAITSALLVLTVLTRPEGAFLLPAFVIYGWQERREGQDWRSFARDYAVMLAPAVLVLATLSGFSLAVNGTLTGTAMAKLHFFRESALPLRTKITIASDQISQFAAPLLPLVVLAALAMRRKETLLVALFWLPVLVLYTLLFPGGLFHYFYRYQHPILPFLAALAGGGAYQLLANAALGSNVSKALVVAGLIVAMVPLWQQYNRWRDVSKEAVIETRRDLMAMTDDLNTLILPNQTLASHDVGAIGYYGHFHVLDLVGLVNPEVVPHQANRSVGSYLLQKRPDYILLYPEWDNAYLDLDAYSHPERYQWVASYPGGQLRKSTYVLYRINYDSASPQKAAPAMPFGPPAPDDEANTEDGPSPAAPLTTTAR